MRTTGYLFSVLTWLATCTPASAGVIFGSNGNLGGGWRWDAAPRTLVGNERSLDGGLRFSMQGGSYEAYRDRFSWSVLPSVADFATAVDQAFGAWTAIDPATGLGTSIYFVNDTANTAVIGSGAFSGTDFNGAEIDLFGENAGDAGVRAVTGISATTNTPVTLTSGTTGYGAAGALQGGAIRGADIKMNNNSGALYSLDVFRRLLTHEIGHALGIADAEDTQGFGFIDDNYDGSTPSTAAATLMNSWALLVNPLNPEDSPGLTQYAPGTVINGSPGLDSTGVNILMESGGLGVGPGNPYSNLFPLSNDDYGMRQFLYPQLEAVPEPSSLALTVLGTAGMLCRRRRRQGN